jgi:hypothetical protein
VRQPAEDSVVANTAILIYWYVVAVSVELHKVMRENEVQKAHHILTDTAAIQS